TGLDLVRLQLAVASGEPLGFGQADVVARGHAIEARVYAEDVAAGFLPAPGTVLGFTPPVADGIRVDAGVVGGTVGSPHFAAMVAKVVAHAAIRGEAAGRLARALERTRVWGLTTNRDLLVAVLRHPAFVDGDTTTDF